jgi:hypothetical protein
MTMTMRKALVDFTRKLREWDGFGVTYVETAQTRTLQEYEADPQDFGGFSSLSEDDRQAILDMIFGADGLKPALTKMFLDPFHQDEPGESYKWDRNVIEMDAYDHERTTHWMRYFVREGLRRTRARGDDLTVITTLYSPPAWTTVQRIVRGRDLDPERMHEVAKYIVSWAKYLREVEGFPVKYVSLHNEGEDFMNYGPDGGEGGLNNDYNLYLPPEQVVAFIEMLRPMLDSNGMTDVGITPGETANWYRFHQWGYADAITGNPEALRNLGLITGHGFFLPMPGLFYGDWRSVGIDTIRAQRPELHAWVTSTSFSDMDAAFIWEIHNNIYAAKLNGLIPWAIIQWDEIWVGGDPNPGTAFRLAPGGGSYNVEPGYYFFKQVCRAGQPGMSVAPVRTNDPQVVLIAFGANGTGHPDAFVIINIAGDAREVSVRVLGTEATRFDGYRTSDNEEYVALGKSALKDDTLVYEAPGGSVTTFYGT